MEPVPHQHSFNDLSSIQSDMSGWFAHILQGGFLICSASGSGKTSLAEWPSLAYATVVECKPLRGRFVLGSVPHQYSSNDPSSLQSDVSVTTWRPSGRVVDMRCKR